MKVSVDRKALQSALGGLLTVVPKKPDRTVLEQVRIRGTEGAIELAGTDLDVYATTELNASVQDPDVAVVPAAKLAALVKEIEDETVELTVSAGACRLADSSGGRFDLACGEVDDFPTDPADGKGGVELSLPVVDFTRMVKQASFAVAREETRYAINGILLEKDGNVFRMVATDGRRLSIAEATAKGQKSCDCVVPTRSLKAILRLLGDDVQREDGQVEIAVREKSATIRSGASAVSTRLIDAKFPDWMAVVPSNHVSELTLPLDMFLSALRRVAVFCDSSNVPIITLSHDGKEALWLKTSGEYGKGECALDSPVECTPFECNFNPAFVHDALRAAECGVFDFRFLDESAPALFQFGIGFTYVLMPITKS